MGKPDLGALIARTMAPAAEVRNIETITGEILDAKRTGGEAILTIGRCLIEAKGMLPHGEWLPWLTEQVELSERTAQKFMRIAREWSNPSALADLGASKALSLLALPPEEREQFMEENNVIDMSARQLEQAIRARDKLAVETVVDQEAIQKARSEVQAEMQAKLDKAKEQQKKAEAAAKLAETMFQDAERARKNAVLSADEDMATFKVLFQQAQAIANQMRGILLKMRSRADPASAQGVEKALNALAEAIGRCAE